MPVKPLPLIGLMLSGLDSIHIYFDLELDTTTKEWTVTEDSNLYVVSQILNDDSEIAITIEEQKEPV